MNPDACTPAHVRGLCENMVLGVQKELGIDEELSPVQEDHSDTRSLPPVTTLEQPRLSNFPNHLSRHQNMAFCNLRHLLWRRYKAHFRFEQIRRLDIYFQILRLEPVFETYYALLSDRSLLRYVIKPQPSIPDRAAQHRIVSDFPRSGDVSVDLAGEIQRALNANVELDSVILSRKEVEALQDFVVALKTTKNPNVLTFRFSQLLELWSECSSRHVYRTTRKIETRAAGIVAEVMRLEWDIFTIRPRQMQHSGGEAWTPPESKVTAARQVRTAETSTETKSATQFDKRAETVAPDAVSEDDLDFDNMDPFVRGMMTDNSFFEDDTTIPDDRGDAPSAIPGSNYQPDNIDSMQPPTKDSKRRRRRRAEIIGAARTSQSDLRSAVQPVGSEKAPVRTYPSARRSRS